jgi:ATP-dependent 26S proteasome regulatory subunit
MRAGRIDTVVSFDAPDAKTSVRFIHMYARDIDGESLLAPGQDLTEAGVAMSGFVPAFIAESVQKAKRFAIHREGPEIKGRLVAEDLVLAGQALRKHMDMVNRKPDPTKEELVAKAVATINAHRNGDDEAMRILKKMDDNF